MSSKKIAAGLALCPAAAWAAGDGGGLALAMVILVVVLYFLPALVASRREHVNANAVFALNLLAGWTLTRPDAEAAPGDGPPLTLVYIDLPPPLPPLPPPPATAVIHHDQPVLRPRPVAATQSAPTPTPPGVGTSGAALACGRPEGRRGAAGRRQDG